MTFAAWFSGAVRCRLYPDVRRSTVKPGRPWEGGGRSGGWRPRRHGRRSTVATVCAAGCRTLVVARTPSLRQAWRRSQSGMTSTVMTPPDAALQSMAWHDRRATDREGCLAFRGTRRFPTFLCWVTTNTAWEESVFNKSIIVQFYLYWKEATKDRQSLH